MGFFQFGSSLEPLDMPLTFHIDTSLTCQQSIPDYTLLLQQSILVASLLLKVWKLRQETQLISKLHCSMKAMRHHLKNINYAFKKVMWFYLHRRWQLVISHTPKPHTFVANLLY